MSVENILSRFGISQSAAEGGGKGTQYGNQQLACKCITDCLRNFASAAAKWVKHYRQEEKSRCVAIKHLASIYTDAKKKCEALKKKIDELPPDQKEPIRYTDGTTGPNCALDKSIYPPYFIDPETPIWTRTEMCHGRVDPRSPDYTTWSFGYLPTSQGGGYWNQDNYNLWRILRGIDPEPTRGYPDGNKLDPWEGDYNHCYSEGKRCCVPGTDPPKWYGLDPCYVASRLHRMLEGIMKDDISEIDRIGCIYNTRRLQAIAYEYAVTLWALSACISGEIPNHTQFGNRTPQQTRENACLTKFGPCKVIFDNGGLQALNPCYYDIPKVAPSGCCLNASPINPVLGVLPDTGDSANKDCPPGSPNAMSDCSTDWGLKNFVRDWELGSPRVFPGYPTNPPLPPTGSE